MLNQRGNIYKAIAVVIVVVVIAAGVLYRNLTMKYRTVEAELETVAEGDRREGCEIKDIFVTMPESARKGIAAPIVFLVSPWFDGTAYMVCGVKPVQTHVYREYEKGRTGGWRFVDERISVVPPGEEPPEDAGDGAGEAVEPEKNME